jgi:hypothetical protein
VPTTTDLIEAQPEQGPVLRGGGGGGLPGAPGPALPRWPNGLRRARGACGPSPEKRSRTRWAAAAAALFLADPQPGLGCSCACAEGMCPVPRPGPDPMPTTTTAPRVPNGSSRSVGCWALLAHGLWPLPALRKRVGRSVGRGACRVKILIGLGLYYRLSLLFTAPLAVRVPTLHTLYALHTLHALHAVHTLHALHALCAGYASQL